MLLMGVLLSSPHGGTALLGQCGGVWRVGDTRPGHTHKVVTIPNNIQEFGEYFTL